MIQERLVVSERDSNDSKLGSLIISARQTHPERVELVVGRPGMPNVLKNLMVGDAVLFETPDEGIFEVRVLSTNATRANVLISHISPRPGIAGGLISQDPNNSAFTSPELAKIRTSLNGIILEMRKIPDLKPEQLDLISRKLDEMLAASERMGRKDWMNLAIGTLTNIIVSAALGPEVGRTLFKCAGTALSWLLGTTLQLLP